MEVNLNWLVIGYGSSLHRDDRFGLEVILTLRQIVGSDVETLYVTQLTPELAESVSRADGAIFVDAATDLSAGEISCLDLNDNAMLESTNSEDEAWSLSHHMTPVLLLKTAVSIYGNSPSAWLYTVGGQDFGLGEEMSELVAATVHPVVNLIRQRITSS